MLIGHRLVLNLTFRALALHHSVCFRTNARNVSYETLNDGQLTLSTQLIKSKLSCYTPPPISHDVLFLIP